MNKQTIISDFGVGNLLFISEGDRVLDLDSEILSNNKWGLYKQVLMDGIGKYEYILVSTHPETRAI